MSTLWNVNGHTHFKTTLQKSVYSICEEDIMLEKSGTCPHCGYEKKHCICDEGNQRGTIHRRSTDGTIRKYNNYTDYREVDDYAMASRINRTDPAKRKIMEELHPHDGESLHSFLERSDTASQKVAEHGIYHHLFGTKKTWACHTTSRYCFICVLAQENECYRMLFQSLREEFDLYRLFIKNTAAGGLALEHQPNKPIADEN